MFTFSVESLDWLINRHPHYFVLFFIWVWLVWATKALPARLYKPFVKPHEATTTVIIPVVDEPKDLFRDVLQRIVSQGPDEIIVIINGKRNQALEEVCAEFAPAVRAIWTPHPGKRNSLRIGIEKARGEISFLVDSDTIWHEGVLRELLKPFADPRVGGATTHQRILSPERNWLTRFADWMEDIRSSCSMPSQSLLGQVGCLPGRTIAFRTSILRRALPEFIAESFLGVHMEVSDDRSLTNYTLKYGYRTVYQRTSMVITDAPTDLKKFIRQQFRWSKGSQYNTLKMWGWMVRHTPLLAFHFTADIVTPFFLVGVFANMIWRTITGTARTQILAGTPLNNLWLQLGLAMVGAMLSIGVRQIPHFRKVPRDILMLPLFVIVLTVIMTPIRIWGFMTCAIDTGWGTRPNGYTAKGMAGLPASQSYAVEPGEYGGATASEHDLAPVMALISGRADRHHDSDSHPGLMTRAIDSRWGTRPGGYKAKVVRGKPASQSHVVDSPHAGQGNEYGWAAAEHDPGPPTAGEVIKE
jgi:hyaluronan synthase